MQGFGGQEKKERIQYRNGKIFVKKSDIFNILCYSSETCLILGLDSFHADYEVPELSCSSYNFAHFPGNEARKQEPRRNW